MNQSDYINRSHHCLVSAYVRIFYGALRILDFPLMLFSFYSDKYSHFLFDTHLKMSNNCYDSVVMLLLNVWQILSLPIHTSYGAVYVYLLSANAIWIYK